MDETSKGIIKRITSTHSKPITVPSGELCTVFYDCKRLSPSELARLAAEATGDLDENFCDVVVGLAYEGILFASAVAGGRQVSILKTDGELYGPEIKGKHAIIVDDVVNTGKRMTQAYQRLSALGAKVVGYACIVDRSAGKFGSTECPLWSAVQTEML